MHTSVRLLLRALESLCRGEELSRLLRIKDVDVEWLLNQRCQKALIATN